MGKFGHLDVPDQWNQYFTKYPQGYTILEALLNWVQQVDDMTDNINNWNDYLDDFVKQFDKELESTIKDILTEWQESGFLDIVISDALQTEMDNVEKRVDELEILTGLNLDNYPRLTGETDDTQRIQRALDAIKTAGYGALWVPDGKIFTVSSRLFIPSNTRIYGKGTIRVKSDIAGIIVFANNDQINGNVNIVIEGITIDGNVAANTSKTDYDFGLDLRNIQGVKISNVTIKNNGGDGIYLGKGTANGCRDVLIEKSTFINSGRNGVSVIYGNNIVIRHNLFKDITAPANPGAGVDVEPNAGDTLTSVLVEHNIAINCQYGFNVWGVAAGVIMDDIIVRNNVANNCYEGFLISSVPNFILTGNKSWKSARNGIDVSALTNGLIEGNTVIDSNQEAGSFYGILLYQNNVKCKIKNNNVYVTDTSKGQVTNIYESGIGNVDNIFEFNNCFPFRTSGMGLFGTGTIDTMNTRYDTIPTSSVMKLGNRKWTTGTAAPAALGATGDICINVAAAKGQPLGWYCTGSAWLALAEVRTNTKAQVIMPAAGTSIVVTHNLPNQPTNIVLGAAGNLGALWVEGVTPTQFTIRCSTAPNFDTAVWYRADA